MTFTAHGSSTNHDHRHKLHYYLPHYWYILKEMRSSLQKVNKMLDDAGKVSGTVSQGVSSMAGMLEGIKTGLSLFSSLRHRDKEDE